MASIKDLPPPTPRVPGFVLYIATGDESGPGKVYQVDENGRVLGVVNLPTTPTGIALHRNNGLVVAMPRDGGRLARIDESGKVTTLFDKDKTVVHPVDVAIAGESDSVVVADNIADVLATTTAAGGKVGIYHRIEGQKWTAQNMSVAIDKDKAVLLGTDSDKGIYRFKADGNSTSNKPLLPGAGGVAADPKTTRWAATQDTNQIYVFDGEEMVKKLRLVPNKSHYRGGLLSFGPANSLCVAVRPSDDTAGQPWLMMYDTEKEEIRSLFPWGRETMTDFVVGPRMRWERNSASEYKNTY